jgi:hypothetical protein
MQQLLPSIGFLIWLWYALFVGWDALYNIVWRGFNHKMIEVRLSIHEAGHAATVWVCSTVSHLRYITIKTAQGGGWTAWRDIQWDKGIDHDWCSLVISLAGMVAEHKFLFTFYPTWSAQDLEYAHNQSARIVANGEINPPWEPNYLPPFVFDAMCPKASPTQMQVLHIAWNKASQIIDQFGDRFQQLVALLREKKTLHEADVEPILGSRAVMCACAAASVFCQPMIGGSDVQETA